MVHKYLMVLVPIHDPIDFKEKSQILALSLAGRKASKSGRKRKVSPEIEKRLIHLIETDRRMAPGEILEKLAEKK